MKSFRDVLNLTALKHTLTTARGLLKEAMNAKDARYTSVPVWRPWRDF